jgi:hypothetical protein
VRIESVTQPPDIPCDIAVSAIACYHFLPSITPRIPSRIAETVAGASSRSWSALVFPSWLGKRRHCRRPSPGMQACELSKRKGKSWPVCCCFGVTPHASAALYLNQRGYVHIDILALQRSSVHSRAARKPQNDLEL